MATRLVLDTPAVKATVPKPSVAPPLSSAKAAFNNSLLKAPQAAASVAPAAIQPPVAPTQQQSFNNSLLGGGGGAAAPASATDNTDYLNGDAQYQLQLASLMKALSDEQADIGNQQTQYNNDYGTAVKNLGWEQPDPTNPADQGQWNFGDTNTAAGRAFNNQQNDFAGRGLLQSSAYGTANDNLTRSLNDQLASTNTAKTNFLNNLTQQQNSFKTDNQQQQQQARIDALNRLAAGVSPVAV